MNASAFAYDRWISRDRLAVFEIEPSQRYRAVAHGSAFGGQHDAQRAEATNCLAAR